MKTPSQPSPTSLSDELREEIYNILDGMQVDYVTQTISLESKFANGVIKQEEYRARCSEEYERCMKESIAAITAAYAEAMNEIIGEDKVLHDYDVDKDGWREYTKRQFSMRDIDESLNDLRAEQRKRLQRLLPTNGSDGGEK